MTEAAHLTETLEKLEQTLLELERHLKAGEDCTSWIHLVFQGAHNLKSGLGMADFAASATLVHVPEDEFDAWRRGKRQPHFEALDFSMRVIDVLREGIEAEAENAPAIARLLDQSPSLLLPADPTKTAVAVSRYGLKLTPDQLAQCDRELATGHNLWRLDKLLNNSLTREQFDQLPVRDDIKDLGQLLAVQPSFDEFKAGMAEQAVKFLFATKLTEAELKLQLYDPLLFQAQGGADNQAPLPSAAALRILIAEDDLFSSKLLKSIFSPYGEVALAMDGAETWKALQEAQAQGKPYQLIVLDIMMPHKSGQEVLKDLRALEERSGVFGLDRAKVLINSALSDMESVQTAFREQADGYLVKPFTAEKILAQMQKMNLVPSGQTGGQ